MGTRATAIFHDERDVVPLASEGDAAAVLPLLLDHMHGQSDGLYFVVLLHRTALQVCLE